VPPGFLSESFLISERKQQRTGFISAIYIEFNGVQQKKFKKFQKKFISD